MAWLVKRAAAAESVLSGLNPSDFSTTDPLRLFIIQAVIIIVLCRLLAWPLRKINQPAVISEVLAGIILGPTAMGRIDGFSARIFPQVSLAYLNLVATIGLVLFLFIVGLEVDLRVMKKGAKLSASVSLLGLVLPFGLGAAIAKGIYDRFIDPNAVSFGHFLLFTGVAMAITAFPVLARILSETKLLYTQVGIVTLAAGVGNDVIGWVLLALSVALINASSGVVAVYILLCTAGWALILFYAIRPVFIWLARRTGSLDQGPTQLMITVTLLLVLLSAWVTDILGVHAIFGAFLVGLMVPHEGGFAVAMTEKIEDLVTVVFLPLYFTLSGLRTNLGTLNSGIAWAYTIAIIVVAFFSKFGGCFAAARLCGMKTRESAAVGTLMSCKGLVELIVLNIGLQAGALNTRVFSMFVLMAVISTVITTPLVLWIYPEKHRKMIDDVDGDHHEKSTGQVQSTDSHPVSGGVIAKKILFVLTGFEHIPALMHLVQLMKPSQDYDCPAPASGLRQRRQRQQSEPASSSGGSGENEKEALGDDSRSGSFEATRQAQAPLSIDALRLVDLTDRTSAVMRGAEIEDTLRVDPVTNVFRSFGQLSRVPVRPSMSIVPVDQFPATLISRAEKCGSDLVVLPWNLPVSARGSANAAVADAAPSSTYPFSSIFGSQNQQQQSSASSDGRSATQGTALARRLMQAAACDIALLVDRSEPLTASLAGRQHIILAFMGGPDDRAALQHAMRFCSINKELRVSVLRFQRTAADEGDGTNAGVPSLHSTMHHTHHRRQASSSQAYASGMTVQDTVYRSNQGATGLQAALEDDLAIRKAEECQAAQQGRLSIEEISTSRPLQDLILSVEDEQPSLIIVGRGRKNPTGGSHRDELRSLLKTGVQTSAVGPDSHNRESILKETASHELQVPQAAYGGADPSSVLSRRGSSAVLRDDSVQSRLANSETCKVVGEVAFALSMANTSAATLVVASANRSNRDDEEA